jgi:hypothetical protein
MAVDDVNALAGMRVIEAKVMIERWGRVDRG